MNFQALILTCDPVAQKSRQWNCWYSNIFRIFRTFRAVFQHANKNCFRRSQAEMFIRGLLWLFLVKLQTYRITVTEWNGYVHWNKSKLWLFVEDFDDLSKNTFSSNWCSGYRPTLCQAVHMFIGANLQCPPDIGSSKKLTSNRVQFSWGQHYWRCRHYKNFKSHKNWKALLGSHNNSLWSHNTLHIHIIVWPLMTSLGFRSDR